MISFFPLGLKDAFSPHPVFSHDLVKRLQKLDGLDHRCANVFVTKKFLNGADIITSLKQMRGKGVAEGVVTGVLDYTCITEEYEPLTQFLNFFIKVLTLSTRKA